jgi:pimeloyl-ACP methyl ester carboxylesterase
MRRTTSTGRPGLWVSPPAGSKTPGRLRLACPRLVVLAGKADPVPHGEAMLAAVDTVATRLQQRHPEVKLARLACGHAIPLERPRELADLIIRFAAASATQL